MSDSVALKERVRHAPGIAIALTVMIAIFAIVAPGFLSPANVSNVLIQSAILMIISLPMTLIIMTEGIDLSMGAVLTLASLCVAIVSVATHSVLFGFLAAVAVGISFGVLNGGLVTFMGIPPFVATLGTLGIAHGLCLILSDGQSVVGVPQGLRDIYAGTVLGIPIPIFAMIIIYGAFHVLLYHTRFGTYVFALGGNAEALRLAGLSPRLLLVTVYAIGGAMAGVAGLLMTARMNAGHPTAGLGMEFDAVAAVAIGGTSFERGNGWLIGTALGVLGVGILRNGLNLIALPSSLQVASVGLLVIVALFLDGLRSKS